MNFFRQKRWSNHDRYWGPFTFSRDKDQYRPMVVVLGSGDGNEGEDPGNSLRVSFLGYTIITILPSIIRPYKTKVVPLSAWSAETVERLGRNYYWHVDKKEYGFSYYDGFLQVFHGRQTHDSTTDKTWGYFLPWTQWRHYRYSTYDLHDKLHATLLESEITSWEQKSAITKNTPCRSFLFTDYDGEVIAARTILEEREAKFGTGWFEWLSWFKKPRIHRVLGIDFSSEIGRGKGSWKGGITGTGIETLPGELHERAFRRYCTLNRLTFNEEYNTEADDKFITSLATNKPQEVASNPQEVILNRFISSIKKLDFELVYTESLVDCGRNSVSTTGVLFIYINREDGILLRFSTHNDRLVHNASIYYNWEPTKGTIRAVEHGRLVGGVWVGRNDIAFIAETINLLRKTGKFVSPWQRSQYVYLGVCNESGDEKNLARFEMFPPWAKEILNGNAILKYN